MTEVVKTRRRYESRRRQEQAAQTRGDILAAAGKLFRERGYGATSMPLIATESGVVVETVYRAFGSKAGLFRAVMEAVLAGGATRADVPVEERPAIRAVIEEPDPRRQIELYVATQPGIHRRSGPLLRALFGRSPRILNSRHSGTRWKRGDSRARVVSLGCSRNGVDYGLGFRSRRPVTSCGRCARLPCTTFWSSPAAGRRSAIRPGSVRRSLGNCCPG